MVFVLLSSLALSFLLLIPLSLKWELEQKTVIPGIIFVGIAGGIITAWITTAWNLGFGYTVVIQILLIGSISGSLLLWRFFRDPERVPPANDNVIVSPADGRILYIKKIDQGEIPSSNKAGRRFPLHEFVQSDLLPSGGHLIGIAMNFLDVHVNRAPIPGRISYLKHIKGLFLSLKRQEALIQNERVLTIIENGRVKVGIVQIASRLVRKIVSFFPEGSEVQRGQRIGVIRFGSQVDLIIPDGQSLIIKVTEGEKVTAGISVLATLQGVESY